MESGTPSSRKCCSTPTQPVVSGAPAQQAVAQAACRAPSPLMPLALLEVPAADFVMGTDCAEANAADGEGPRRRVTLSAFRIAPTVVTNRDFAAFVRATHHVSDAERLGNSYVFHLQLPDALRAGSAPVPGLPWWRRVDHACWQRPEGPGSHVHARPEHPVVHVSWHDAQAYCAWAGGMLPSEAQWEYAARGGLEGRRLPWGDALEPEGQRRCNTWRGRFPDLPAQDWTPGPCAADAFAPNGFGLYNACGNVWEWCADAFHPEYHRATATHDPLYTQESGQRSMRGGSFLCHDSYCNRYRLPARSSNAPHSTASNIGFRLAAAA